MMKSSSFRKVLFVAMALLVLPIVGCAAEEAAPPPPPPAPPAGTITVTPAQISYTTIYATWPPVASAIGIPDEAVPVLNPAMALLGIPIKFTGEGWPADELITIDLVYPADVEIKGLDRARGEDSVGIAMATADASGNFEATMEAIPKINWLMRADWKPIVAADWATVNPIPAGTYTLRAVGLDARTVVTTTWDLELVKPEGWEPPAAEEPEEAAPPVAAGEVSFEAATYTNADYGFSVRYPAKWAEQEATAETTVFYAADPAKVPALFICVVEGATFADALTAALEGAGGSDVKIKSESETTLADG
ncbi:MAG: hypothetical protein KAT75_04385, partial [Dehalococcoidia bacterium]|nr:hypothetical protein [Dehalococcoidia bacterium]